MSAGAFTRRQVLAGAGGTAAALGLGAGLSGCGGGGGGGAEQNTFQANTTVRLPDYIPYAGVEPDLAPTEQGVDAAFRTFPADNPRAVPEPPGSGATITGLANIYFAVPPGPSSNPYWRGLNERMNVDLQLQMVSAADYGQRFATTIAGNDLPDLVQTPNGTPPPVPNLPQLMARRFTDLTEHLSGAAISDYPNLANIPTRSWRSTVYNGGIYGVPIPRGAIASYQFARADLFAEAGVSTEPRSFEELLETCRALTNPGRRRWAFGVIGQVRAIIGRMNGEINVWDEQGGQFTHVYETDQFAQTVRDLTELWDAGVIHPDAFNPANPFKQLFNAGTIAITDDGYPGWNQYILDNAADEDFELGLMPSYLRDGSGLAPWKLGSGIFSITMLAQTDDPEVTRQRLRVLDYLAAPFGTEEYLYRVYGEEGVDHELDDEGNPVLTGEGQTNTVLPIRYLADSPYTIYQPGRPQDADTQHEYQSLEIPTGVDNPAVGLFSNAAATDNATADGAFLDRIWEIVQGRQPGDSLPGVVDTWRSEVGDAMRNEYQEQLQAGSSAPR